MVALRKLQPKDTEGMLKWMHDESVANKYKTDFLKFTARDAEDFILHSFSEDNQHFAAVDRQDHYLGTVSLKNISQYNKNAELASVFRRADSGVLKSAVQQAINYAFDELGLEEIYVHVLEDDADIINIYKEMGFLKGGTFVSQLYIQNQSKKLCWFYKSRPKNTTGKHQLLRFHEKGDMRGHMVVIEQLKDVPFDIKRLFYIYGSERDTKRGMHANRKSEFVLINIAGTSKIKAFDGHDEHIYELTQPHTGVYLPKMVWKEMYDFSDDSILLVLSSEIYDADEYIRDFNEYMKEIRTPGKSG